MTKPSAQLTRLPASTFATRAPLECDGGARLESVGTSETAHPPGAHTVIRGAVIDTSRRALALKPRSGPSPRARVNLRARGITGRAVGLRDSGAGACLRCDAGHAVVVVEGEEPFGFRQLSAAGVDPFEAGPVCPSDELLGVA